jgi:hypothetical protein
MRWLPAMRINSRTQATARPYQASYGLSVRRNANGAARSRTTRRHRPQSALQTVFFSSPRCRACEGRSLATRSRALRKHSSNRAMPPKEGCRLSASTLFWRAPIAAETAPTQSAAATLPLTYLPEPSTPSTRHSLSHATARCSADSAPSGSRPGSAGACSECRDAAAR